MYPKSRRPRRPIDAAAASARVATSTASSGGVLTRRDKMSASAHWRVSWL